MIKLGREKKELGVIFDQIGTPTYARDLAKTIMTAIEEGIQPGIYHYSNEGVISWYDFTKAIHRIAGITTCHVKSACIQAEYPTPAAKALHTACSIRRKIKTTYRHRDSLLGDFSRRVYRTVEKREINIFIQAVN
jgi:dTDP-4-dehydrorhamnose reductase